MQLPKWLQGMVLPTLMLWVYALAVGVAGGMSPAERLPWRAELVLELRILMVRQEPIGLLYFLLPGV